MPNVESKESVGSFNDQQEKQKIRGLDKLKLLWEDLNKSQIHWSFEDDIKWLEFERYSNEFAIVIGKPVTSVHCSKFCSGKVLSMRNEITNLAAELGHNTISEPAETQSALYTEELSSDVKKIIGKYNPNLLKRVKVLNYEGKLWDSLESGSNEAFERKAFDDIMDVIDTLWRDDSFVLQGYPMLTQFTVGVIYVIGHLFEKVGFIRPVGQDFAVIFQKFRSWNPQMEKFVSKLADVIDELDVNKSVLAVIPLQNLVLHHGDFYRSVTAINSLCVQELNRNKLNQLTPKQEE